MADSEEKDVQVGADIALSEADLSRIPEDLWPKLRQFQVEHRLEMVRSPVLPPAVLEEYNRIMPGLPDRLITWTEEESSHRREMERKGFDEIKTFRSRSQIFGLIIAVIGIVGSVLAGIFAPPDSTPGAVAAAVVVLAAIGGPIAVRIFAENFPRSRSRDKE